MKKDCTFNRFINFKSFHCNANLDIDLSKGSLWAIKLKMYCTNIVFQ